MEKKIFITRALCVYFPLILVGMVLSVGLNMWINKDNLLYQIIFAFLFFIIPFSFLPWKYVITSTHTLVIFSFFGLIKRNMIPIENIVEIRVAKKHQLDLKYKKEGYAHPSYIILELSEKDMMQVRNELLKQNPKIKIL